MAKRTRAPDKSCYILELSVDPGGARRADVFVYPDFESICKILRQEFPGSGAPRDLLAGASGSALLAVSYGETIALHVVEGGRVSLVVDLHPFVQVQWSPDGPTVALDQEEKLAELRQLLEGDAAIEGLVFHVDWALLQEKVPALEGPPIEPCETIRVRANRKQMGDLSSYLCTDEPICFGYNDLENGENPAQDWEDPRPPAGAIGVSTALRCTADVVDVARAFSHRHLGAKARNVGRLPGPNHVRT